MTKRKHAGGRPKGITNQRGHNAGGPRKGAIWQAMKEIAAEKRIRTKDSRIRIQS